MEEVGIEEGIRAKLLENFFKTADFMRNKQGLAGRRGSPVDSLRVFISGVPRGYFLRGAFARGAARV
jgi:hypothetical protein